jgi:hypothetical protein
MAERSADPTQWDAPNQQVVRPDESPPWEEGEGGSTSEDGDPKDEPAQQDRPGRKERKSEQPPEPEQSEA